MRKRDSKRVAGRHKEVTDRQLCLNQLLSLPITSLLQTEIVEELFGKLRAISLAAREGTISRKQLDDLINLARFSMVSICKALDEDTLEALKYELDSTLYLASSMLRAPSTD